VRTPRLAEVILSRPERVLLRAKSGFCLNELTW